MVVNSCPFSSLTECRQIFSLIAFLKTLGESLYLIPISLDVPAEINTDRHPYRKSLGVRSFESVRSDETFVRGQEFLTGSTSQTKVENVSSLRVRDPITLEKILESPIFLKSFQCVG